jgi:membrane associated rhomboid family serine protease
MGFYDRDYQRGDYYERQSGFYLGGPRTLTTNLVIVMFVIYVLQIATRGPRSDGWFTETFSLHGEVITHPWLAFQLLTYGFLHDVRHVGHIVFNMIALWFFGRSVEYRYGKREYLTFFLVSVVAAGVTYLVGEFIAHRNVQEIPAMLGASGGISAVVILFCLNFPHQIIYIWGVLPVPAWALGILFIGQDVYGAAIRQTADGPNVAFTAHLGGALFALLYFQSGMRLERLLPSTSMLASLKPKPKLKVHDPESAEETDEAVDEILKKIQDHGRDSLTRRERRILEDASREYQKRRH